MDDHRDIAKFLFEFASDMLETSKQFQFLALGTLRKEYPGQSALTGGADLMDKLLQAWSRRPR